MVGATSADCIDFDFSGTKSIPTPPNAPIATSGTVDGTGDSAVFTLASAYMGDPSGSDVTVADLNSITDPTGGASTLATPFITFAGEPWTITLTEVMPGSYGAASCLAGTSTSTDQCTPPGTPFNESQTSCATSTIGVTTCDVAVNFNFTGVANDGSGNKTLVSGTFGTTFTGTTLQQVNEAILAGHDVVTSDSATIGFTAVPEPVTFALVAGGLFFLGLVGRKNPRQL